MLSFANSLISLCNFDDVSVSSLICFSKSILFSFAISSFSFIEEICFSIFSLFDKTFSISVSTEFFFSSIFANLTSDFCSVSLISLILSIICLFPLIKSSFSKTAFSNFLSILFISFSNLFISDFLPKIFTVLFWTDPPVIAPDGFIISPSKVTILKEWLFTFASLIAFSILSTITVLPSKFKIIFSYFLSAFTKSDATPIIPSVLVNLLMLFPLIDEIGKNDARPNLLLLKNSISFFASWSVSVTIFCIAAPNDLSIAVWYLESVEMIFASTPLIPFFNDGLLSHAINISFTDFMYPSFSFSVSTKKLYLDVVILFLSVKSAINSSYFFVLLSISSFLFCISSSAFLFLFLSISISFNSFETSFFNVLVLSNSEINFESSFFSCLIRSS